MSQETEALNRLYYPLHTKCSSLLAHLNGCALPASMGWYNGHYSKNAAGEYTMDYYPIPVISVAGCCDIEIGLEQLSVTAKLARDKAGQYAFEKLADIPFEAFGVEDYLTDLYDRSMPLDRLRRNIRESREAEIGFSFLFPPETGNEALSAFIAFLCSEGFYY